MKNRVRDYEVPELLIGVRMAANGDGIAALVQEQEETGCPLRSEVPMKGYIPTDPDVETLVDGIHVIESTPELIPAAMIICMGTENPGCYIDRPTKRHDKVGCREDCPVYKHILGLLTE